jgi:hypothetical protein
MLCEPNREAMSYSACQIGLSVSYVQASSEGRCRPDADRKMAWFSEVAEEYEVLRRHIDDLKAQKVRRPSAHPPVRPSVRLAGWLCWSTRRHSHPSVHPSVCLRLPLPPLPLRPSVSLAPFLADAAGYPAAKQRHGDRPGLCDEGSPHGER